MKFQNKETIIKKLFSNPRVNPIEPRQIEHDPPQRERPQRIRGAPHRLIDYYVNTIDIDHNNNNNQIHNATSQNNNHKHNRINYRKSMIRQVNNREKDAYSETESSTYESAEDEMSSYSSDFQEFPMHKPFPIPYLEKLIKSNANK